MDPAVRAKLRIPLSETCSLERTLLRVLHYPGNDGTEDTSAIRAGAHEDINLITVLPVGSSRGLQVYNKANQTWYEVPQEAKSIVVNIGDMLQELTGGEYVSTTHRVMKPDDEPASGDRMSTPCFIHCGDEVYLSERYPRANDYLMERLRELGLVK
jgi:isopenicillin N synthase-like dioxygenase